MKASVTSRGSVAVTATAISGRQRRTVRIAIPGDTSGISISRSSRSNWAPLSSARARPFPLGYHIPVLFRIFSKIETMCLAYVGLLSQTANCNATPSFPVGS